MKMRSMFARVITAGAFSLASGIHPLQAEERIRIGVSTALTGNAAQYGIDLKNTLLFANTKLAGGAYDLIFEDDKCNGKDAVSVAQRFVDVLHVRYVLGFACSGTLLSSASIYEKSKTLVITSSSSAPAISAAGDYIFRTWPSDSAAAKKLYEYMGPKYARIGVLNEQTEYAQGFYKAFREANTNGTVKIFGEDYLTDNIDFRSLILKLKNQGMQALFINSQTEITFLAALKQFREMGLSIPVYGALFPGSLTFLQNAKDLANGIIFVDLPSPDEVLTPQDKGLFEEFRRAYGELNSIPVMFLTTYEAMHALHLALTSGLDPRQFLYRTTFHGIFGDWSFDENGDIRGLRPVLRIIEQRKSKLLSE